jgi:filamentous hemagglutinin family protein
MFILIVDGTPGKTRRPAEPHRHHSSAEYEEARMVTRTAPVALTLLIAALAPLAWSAPTQPQVVGGAQSATVSVDGRTTHITQLADRAVINWRTFNVAREETVAFVQPSASAILLNRITDSKSTIDGSITANGRIFLVNTRGILFGRNAQVNVGSLVAMTADTSADNFLKGDPAFRTASLQTSTLINLGQISTAPRGNVLLLAPSVSNQGSISAPDGRVVLASGRAFLVDLFGDGLVHVATAAVSGPPSAPVNQVGNIEVGKGTLLVRRAFAADALVGTLNNIPIADIANRAVILRGGAVAFVGASAKPTVSESSAWIKPGSDGGGGGIIDSSPTYGLASVTDTIATAAQFSRPDAQFARLEEFNRLSEIPDPWPGSDQMLAGGGDLAANELYSIGGSQARQLSPSVGITAPSSSPSGSQQPTSTSKRVCTVSELVSKGCR